MVVKRCCLRSAEWSFSSIGNSARTSVGMFHHGVTPAKDRVRGDESAVVCTEVLLLAFRAYVLLHVHGVSAPHLLTFYMRSMSMVTIS